MEDYTAEELKTFIGQIYYALRDGWLFPTNRVWEAETAIHTLYHNYPTVFTRVIFDTEIALLDKFKDLKDGTELMKSRLYDYATARGSTERVWDALAKLSI